MPGNELFEMLEVLGLISQFILDLFSEKNHGLVKEGLGLSQFSLSLEEGSDHEEVVLLVGMPSNFLWNLFSVEGSVAILEDLR